MTTRVQIIAPDGRVIKAKYTNPADAVAEAERLWPGVEQDFNGDEGGWNLQAYRPRKTAKKTS